MSNGLKTFFTELADVYRGATGTTEKIVANKLPSKFEELLASGGTGGSGGTLCYKYAHSLPYDYSGAALFTFNNENYLYSRTGTSTAKIYKYVNDNFTSFCDVETTFAKTFTSSKSVIECDGYVYFSQAGSKNYGRWNGTTFETFLNVFPASVSYFVMFKHGNDIYFTLTPTIRIDSKYKTLIYKVDKSTGELITIYDGDNIFTPGASSYTACYTVDNEGYAINTCSYPENYALYKFNGSSYDKVRDLTGITSPLNSTLTKNRKLYFTSNSINYDGTVETYDVDSGAREVLGKAPFPIGQFNDINDEIHILSNQKFYQGHLIMDFC